MDVRDIVKTTLIITTIFAFLQTLFFRPAVFADVAYADSLSLRLERPMVMALVVVASMTVAGTALGVVGRFWHRAWRLAITSVSCALPAGAALALAHASVLAPRSDALESAIPLLPSVCLGIAVVAQTYALVQTTRLGSADLLLASGLGVLVAFGLSYLLFALLAVPVQGCLAIAVMLVASGAVLTGDLARVQGVGRSRSRIPDARVGDGPCGGERAPGNLGIAMGEARCSEGGGVALGNAGLRVTLVLPLALEVLLGTISLGLSWETDLFATISGNPAVLPVVLVLGLLFVLALQRYWRLCRDVRALMAGAAAPVVLLVGATVVAGVAPTQVTLAITLLSEQLFLLLVWVGALVIGRAVSSTEAIVPGTIMLVLVVYGGCVFASGLVGAPLVRALLALADLLLLAYLVLYFASEARRTSDVLAGGGVSDADGDAPDGLTSSLDARCTAVSRRASLSPREAEILPLLAIGLSAGAIAQRILVSPKTVSTYRYRIYEKLGVHSHDELVELLGLM